MSESKSKYLRVPKVIRFPFGYTVVVKQVTLREMKAMNGNEACWGLWDVDTRTIYIAKNAPISKKRYLVCHELKHVLADFEHFYTEEGIVKG